MDTDIADVCVADLVFKKPVVYGSFLLKKVDGNRVTVNIECSQIKERVVKTTKPSKIVVQQLLQLEERVREVLGSKKFLTPMIVVNPDMQIVCQLSMHKTESYPIDEYGRVNATLIGIRISGQFCSLIWRVNSFDAQPEEMCMIASDPEEQEIADADVDVDGFTLNEIKESLIEACRVEQEGIDSRLTRLRRVNVLLEQTRIIPSDLETARFILDDNE